MPRPKTGGASRQINRRNLHGSDGPGHREGSLAGGRERQREGAGSEWRAWEIVELEAGFLLGAGRIVREGAAIAEQDAPGARRPFQNGARVEAEQTNAGIEDPLENGHVDIVERDVPVEFPK